MTAAERLRWEFYNDPASMRPFAADAFDRTLPGGWWVLRLHAWTRWGLARKIRRIERRA